VPRTQAAERAAPQTDQVGTLATLTTAGLLATVGAALVLVLDDDVSPWEWTAVGFALVFGVVALGGHRRSRAAPSGGHRGGRAAHRRRRRRAGDSEACRGPAFNGVSPAELSETRAAIDAMVAGLLRRVGDEAFRRPETADAGSTDGTNAGTRGGGSTRIPSTG
jgi:hypothetical protein